MLYCHNPGLNKFLHKSPSAWRAQKAVPSPSGDQETLKRMSSVLRNMLSCSQIYTKEVVYTSDASMSTRFNQIFTLLPAFVVDRKFATARIRTHTTYIGRPRMMSAA